MQPIIIYLYTLFAVIELACPHVDRQDVRNLDIQYSSYPPNPTPTSSAFAISLEGRRVVGRRLGSMARPWCLAFVGHSTLKDPFHFARQAFLQNQSRIQGYMGHYY